MRVILTASDVRINDTPLGSTMRASEIAKVVGPPVSGREIPMHPTGTRKANVSDSGIVWYVDYPEDRVSHLHIALFPGDTPERPPLAFTGSARLGALHLHPELSEDEFARSEEVVVRGHLHTWSYESTAHDVSFVFKRRRNAIGKRSRAYRLAFVSIGFKSNRIPSRNL